jgi:hypothetical protein
MAPKRARRAVQSTLSVDAMLYGLFKTIAAPWKSDCFDADKPTDTLLMGR